MPALSAAMACAIADARENGGVLERRVLPDGKTVVWQGKPDTDYHPALTITALLGRAILWPVEWASPKLTDSHPRQVATKLRLTDEWMKDTPP